MTTVHVVWDADDIVRGVFWEDANAVAAIFAGELGGRVETYPLTRYTPQRQTLFQANASIGHDGTLNSMTIVPYERWGCEEVAVPRVEHDERNGRLHARDFPSADEAFKALLAWRGVTPEDDEEFATGGVAP